MKVTSLNTTAYRIFKILQWLCEGPLSAEEINQRFQADPLTGRAASEETLALYLNTLKKLGCDIIRRGTGDLSRYELLAHPFGLPLGDRDIEVLIEAFQRAEAYLTFPDIFYLGQFFEKVLRHHPPTGSTRRLSQHLQKRNALGYMSRRSEIKALHQAVETKALLFVSYQSPIHGLEHFYFLPSAVLYQRGVLRLNGCRLGLEAMTMLRIDRIDGFACVEHHVIRQTLLASLEEKEPVELHLYNVAPETLMPFLMNEEITYYPQAPQPFLKVVLYTSDFFALKQHLLCLGTPFKVIEPVVFRHEMHTTLSTMAALYQKPALHAKQPAPQGQGV